MQEVKKGARNGIRARGARCCRGRLVSAVSAAVVLASIGCQQLERQASESVVRTRALEKGSSVSVVMSSIGAPVRRIVTNGDEVDVSINFDPEIVDVADVDHYILWSCESLSSPWEKVLECGPADIPVRMSESPGEDRLREGVTGLRASVVLKKGEPILLPQTGDEPSVWLVVDRSAPDLRWVAPAADESVRRSVRDRVPLAWELKDDSVSGEVNIEWSRDGQEWLEVGSIQAAAGRQSFPWKIPKDIPGQFSLRLTARDLVGHTTTAIQPVRLDPGVLLVAQPGGEVVGTAPISGETDAGGTIQAIPRPELEQDARLRLTPIGRGVVPGGQPLVVRWDVGSIVLPEGVRVEWSRDGGAEWLMAGAVPAAKGELAWDVPCEDVSACLVRLRAATEDGREIVAGPGSSFMIDCSPPKVRKVGVASVVGGETALDVEIDSGDASGLATTAVWMRLDATEPWRRLAESKVRLVPGGGGGRVELDLAALPEASYQLWVQATDGVGNSAPEPDANTVPAASFRLDRTPPAIAVDAGPGQWVEGLETQLRVRADWTDVAPPLLLEGRSGTSSWQEVARWTELPPPGETLNWRVPVGHREYRVRLVASDQAGNRGVQEIPTRGIEAAIMLTGVGNEVDASAPVRLGWNLHPRIVERIDDYKIQVHYRTEGEGATGVGPWTSVCENLEPGSVCLWDATGAAAGKYRFQATLTRARTVVSTSVSGVTTLRGGSSPSAEPLIAADSMTHLRLARKSSDKARELRAGLGGRAATAEETDRLTKLDESTQLNYQNALELDANNYYAAYGLAQFLNRGGDGGPRVESLLQQALKVRPDYYWALNDLGALYIRRERYDLAVPALERAAKVRPTFEVHYNLAIAQFFQSEWTASRASFEAALASADGKQRVATGDVWYYIAHTYLQEGNRDAVRKILREKGGTISEAQRAELLESLGP